MYLNRDVNIQQSATEMGDIELLAKLSEWDVNRRG